LSERHALQLAVVLTEAVHGFPDNTVHQGIEDKVDVRRSAPAQFGRMAAGMWNKLCVIAAFALDLHDRAARLASVCSA
jgi:hypothetical protein